jgi:ankyrin repeat protein/nucleoside phosphorylase
MGPESRDDFRVAVICALPLEAAAVLDLFDQRYDKDGSKYSKQEGDSNTYSTGRIGRHDIVLAHMPGMGVYNASRVASNIQLSFKEVNLALVVGVCGGAPLKQPIILGDVVISNSVVEFYTGRNYSDGVQARKGLVDTLGRPNTEIRGLLGKFQIPLIRRELEAELQQNLAELCRKNDTLRYPGVEHDRLFAASYRHMHRRDTSHGECLCVVSQSINDPVCSDALESGCDELECDADAPETPSRRVRFASGFPTPHVHIGTVGATTVMKSGEHRDIMARESNIIAFEMEGAGVWEVLPCVIVKGVCDYADSHKNKKWQDYAAATAASAAKAFLSHWTSKQHDSIAAEGSSRKRPLLLGDEDGPSTSSRARQRSISRRPRPSPMSVPPEGQTSSDILSVPGQADLDAQVARLEALDFEQLDARHATIRTAHTATCEWLLSKSEYMDWQDKDKLPEHHGFLWIKGKPGAGKSTIMKYAYTNAENHGSDLIAISYFFNARGEHLEKSTCGMYRSLLFQLLSKLPRLQAVLSTTEAASLQNTSPDLWTAESLQSLFCKTIERLEDQRLTCFVDALDECENNEDQVREMVDFFETLGECAVKDKIRLLVCFSSRHYPHITIDKCVELTLETQEGHSEDITKYVNSKLKVGRSKRVEQVKIDVLKKSQGVFLWVVLVIPMLQKAYDHGQVYALGKRLKDIPKDLHELFRDILSRDTQNMENLVLCLRWILYVERPLSPEELFFAILSASETGPVTAWDPEDITPEDISRFILSSSKGLAESTRSKTPIIQFIHESVRDFLLKENGSTVLQLGVDFTSPGSAHDLLKKNCQRYFLSISQDHSLKNSKETANMFPFLDYSIRYIFMHAELAASHGTPQETFLAHYPLENWISLHDHIEQYNIRRHGNGTSLLYILTEKDLFHLFRVEVVRSQSINAKGGRYNFPIIAAAAVGNKQMLELLLKHYAYLDERHKHALSIAVDRSDASILEVLMSHGAVSSWTAVAKGALLTKAMKKKDMSTIKLLLRDGEFLAAVKTLAQGVFFGAAIDNQDNEIFKILVEFGVIGPDRHDGFGFALVAASEHGNEALVRMFLDKRGPYYAGDDAIFSGEPLLGAVSKNQPTIVRILLEYGIGTAASNQNGRTAVHIASRNRKETIVQMLLEHGADVDASDTSGITALHEASNDGGEAVVRKLLDWGADISASDEDGRTALHEASRTWNETIVQMLLEHGADVNASGAVGMTALHEASRTGNKTIVQILLGRGADIHALDKYGMTALHRASEEGHEVVVRSLLENGSSINALDMHHGTPLRIASLNQRQTCVQILLEYGADVNEGDSPLYAITCIRSHYPPEAILRTLLEHGADPNRHSYYSRNLPLHEALHDGMTNFVRLLLNYRADVRIPSSRYENAFAALRSCGDTTKRAACEALLLERSALQPSQNHLTWVDDTPYLNFPQNFPQEILGDTTLNGPEADQASGVDEPLPR